MFCYILYVLLRNDLSSFIQRSFATVDPGSRYKHNWHIDAIAHRLERVARGVRLHRIMNPYETILIMTVSMTGIRTNMFSVKDKLCLCSHRSNIT